MSRYGRQDNTAVWVVGFTIIILLFVAVAQLAGVRSDLRRQYEYEAEADLCWQQVGTYTARACYVEREGNEYHWYNKAIGEQA